MGGFGNFAVFRVRVDKLMTFYLSPLACRYGCH